MNKSKWSYWLYVIITSIIGIAWTAVSPRSFNLPLFIAIMVALMVTFYIVEKRLNKK